jgi:hypothetical protein
MISPNDALLRFLFIERRVYLYRLFYWHLYDLFWNSLKRRRVLVELFERNVSDLVLGDRYTRELTTVMFPEMPQSDDASVVPDIPKTDPCYRFKFEGMDKHEFYSPGFEDKPNYTNNTNCVRVLEGEFLFSLITGTFNLPGSLR